MGDVGIESIIIIHQALGLCWVLVKSATQMKTQIRGGIKSKLNEREGLFFKKLMWNIENIVY